MTKDQHMSEKVESGLEAEIDEALATWSEGPLTDLLHRSRLALSQLRSTQDDLELALEDAEMRAESAGRNASAFEERMGDLQVENGRLKDEVQRERERHRKTWRQLEQVRLAMGRIKARALVALDDELFDLAESQQAEPAPAQDGRDFWVWLDQAYRDGSKGESPTFTKYNMQVAFKAGAEWQRTRPAQTEQQPVAARIGGVISRKQRLFSIDILSPELLDVGTELYVAPIAQTAPQPEQSGLVMPPRFEMEPYQTVDAGSTNYKAGWNRCLNEFARLNATQQENGHE